MGRPLRKLHQAHFCSPCGLDICNIRTTGSVSHPPVPSTGNRALCQKKIGEKRRIASWRASAQCHIGNKIPYFVDRHKESL
jgi:hypothetical protein